MSEGDEKVQQVGIPNELPVMSESSVHGGKNISPPIPVFVGKKRVLGEVYRIERYGAEDENGLPVQAPGNGETVYLVRRTEPGWKNITGTYTAADLMIRR